MIGTSWAEHEPTEAQRQGLLETHPWEDYALWHLGLTEGAADRTLARYDFVVGDFTRLHRSALVECAARAATYRDRSIEAPRVTCSRSSTTGPGSRPGPDRQPRRGDP